MTALRGGWQETGILPDRAGEECWHQRDDRQDSGGMQVTGGRRVTYLTSASLEIGPSEVHEIPLGVAGICSPLTLCPCRHMCRNISAHVDGRDEQNCQSYADVERGPPST